MYRTYPPGADVASAPRPRSVVWQFSELSTAARHLRGGHVVVSSFDGMHTGHSALLKLAADKAAALGGSVVALLFEEASVETVPLADRIETIALLREAGAEVLLLGFEQFSSWLEVQALCDLVRELEPKSVTMGAGFRFGRGGTWLADQLAHHVRSHGLSVEVTGPAPAAHGFGAASAENIRAHLSAGDLCAASYLLGRHWSIEGPVVHGYKRGRELGFPTANVQPGRPLPLAHGIYAVRLQIDGTPLQGVASYGTRPQFDNGAPLLEVHILDFSRDIYGALLRVEFVCRQRAELVFDSVDDLKRQMEVDRSTARDVLGQGDRNPSRVVAHLK